MLDVWEVAIPVLTGDRKRRAYVCLPDGYFDDEEKRYPVLYMFDGHNLFSDAEATYGKCWGLSEYMSATRTQLIIAAVECDREGNGRLSEYSPVDFAYKDSVTVKGRGKKYMDWLVGTFKPYIDGNLRTLPDRAHTAVAGSSMGGLMTVYALGKYNKYFSRGAALSPSLWVYGDKLAEAIGKYRFAKDTVLYMDYGSREFDAAGLRKSSFCTATSALIQKGVNVTARIVAGGTHSEASWERQIPFFMQVLGFNNKE